ncbi:MAG: hypothetical protein ACREQZ_09770 [Woeseiaceae bacterium]
MKILMTLSMIVTMTMLAACGGSDDRDTADAEEERETVFDPLTDALGEAEAVEDAALEHKQRMDEALRRVEEGLDDAEPEADGATAEPEE